jgi:hypothetical protein
MVAGTRDALFPITLRNGSQGSASSSPARTYFVCLGCGKEFPDDWREMRLVKRFPKRQDPAQEFATRRSA